MIKVKVQRILTDLVRSYRPFSYLITDGHWLAHFGAKVALWVHRIPVQKALPC